MESGIQIFRIKLKQPSAMARMKMMLINFSNVLSAQKCCHCTGFICTLFEIFDSLIQIHDMSPDNQVVSCPKYTRMHVPKGCILVCASIKLRAMPNGWLKSLKNRLISNLTKNYDNILRRHDCGHIRAFNTNNTFGRISESVHTAFL